jgi:predicted acetyltransferase
MKQIYEASKEGYSPEEKRIELFDMRSYYLIATEAVTGQQLGYCHFRFDMDADCEVIYCYELQVEPDARKIGLGQFMMKFLEALCVHLKMEKVILTCSKINSIGQKFFREKLKYLFLLTILLFDLNYF